ncbi:LOW QUALITY PROTEIN: hypothetical protein HID58_057806 [Brassica napus]|uniref:Uncharacterized protein n=1 Tax=Brassica napus TaxID=3708 RepID=A0ABQ7XHS3_BRANA|nr:LOW QUALITY PROTEIN: hypothetical protein HID58_057806 [Brassica napus]
MIKHRESKDARGERQNGECPSRFGAFEHPIQRLPSGSRVYAQPESLLGGNYSSWRPDSGNESGYSPFRREKLSWSRRGKDVLYGVYYLLEEEEEEKEEEEGEEDEMATEMATEIRGRRRRRRKRADMGGNDGLASETPTQQQVFVLDTPVAGVRAGDGLESETPTHQQLGVLETPHRQMSTILLLKEEEEEEEEEEEDGMGVDDGLESETPTQQQVFVLETPVACVKVGDVLESETPTHQQLGVLETPVASADEHNSVMVTHAPAVSVDDSLESDSNSATIAGVRVGDDLVSETPTHQQLGIFETPIASADEHNFVMVTHALAVGLKRMFPASTARLHKVLDYIKKEISAGEEEEAEFITSEKKLLNSIEMVEKIVMDEIQKMQSTPLAKREERKKKVKCLVVMQRFTLKKK